MPVHVCGQNLEVFGKISTPGPFSVCYHVCPTNLSLQFDTTMMYVICILCYVKLYQFRHPDATANAYSTMGVLGVLVLIEALALYSSSWIGKSNI